MNIILLNDHGKKSKFFGIMFIVIVLTIFWTLDTKAANRDAFGFNVKSEQGTDTDNPYGNKDQKFMLMEVPEAAGIMSGFVSNQNCTTTWYDDKLTESAILPNRGAGKTNSSSTAYNHRYVASTPFDPMGHGKKDCIAFVGYDEKKGQLFTWVYDAANNTYSTPTAVSLAYPKELEWMSTLYQWNYDSFITITAGDYDGDSKDTFVINYPQHIDYSGKGVTVPSTTKYNLKEFQYRDSTTSYKGNINISNLVDHFVWMKFSELTKIRSNMVTISLTSSDLNRDGTDELIAASGWSIMEDPDQDTACLTERSSKVGIYNQVSGEWKTTYTSPYLKNQTYENNVLTYENRMRSACVTTGDIDFDGYEEVVVAGQNNKYKAGAAYDSDWMDNIDGETYLTNVIECKVTSGKDVSTTYTAGSKCGSVNMSKWVMNGLLDNETDYGNRVSPAISMVCAAVDGAGQADSVMISGILYSFSGGSNFSQRSISSAYNTATNDFDTDMARGTGANEPKNKWMGTAIAGNFDGNDAGREQILYVSARRSEAMKGSAKVTYSVNKLSVTPSLSQDGESNYSWKEQTYAQAPIQVNGDDHNLYYHLVKVDPDNDSEIGRFKSKCRSFTQPEVAAVLQAAPTFSDLNDLDVSGNYPLNAGTTYTTSSGAIVGSTSSQTTHATAYVCAEVNLKYAKINVEGSYTHEWISEYESELERSFSYAYTGGRNENTVVMYRTPVTYYTYEVDGPEGTKDMVIGIPDGRVHATLSVEDYNEDVVKYNHMINSEVSIDLEENNPDYAAYNKKVEEYNAKNAKRAPNGDPINPKDTDLLEKKTNDMLQVLDPKDLPTPGDPVSYQDGSNNSSLTDLIQMDAMEVKRGNALGHSELTDQSSNTTAQSYTNGFSVDVTIMGGYESTAGFGAFVGGGAGGGKTWGSGTYTTNYSSVTQSGEVANFPYRTDMSKYRMICKFATWRTSLNGTTIPMLGYIIPKSSLSYPASAPKKMKVTETKPSSVSLSWEQGLYKGDTYNLYQVFYDEEEETYSYKLLMEGLTDTKCVVSNGVDGKPLVSGGQYQFAVSGVLNVDEDQLEGNYSKVVSATIPLKQCKITVEKDPSGEIPGLDAITFSNKATGESVKEGDTVPEGTVLCVTVRSKAGYYINKVLQEQIQQMQINPAPIFKEKTMEVPIIGDCIFKVETVIISSQVTYDVNNSEYGDISGKLESGEKILSGQTVGENMILKAEPAEGFLVDHWELDGAIIQTEEGMPWDELQYELNPVLSKHHVRVFFRVAEKYHVKLNQPEGARFYATEGEKDLGIEFDSYEGSNIILHVETKPYYVFQSIVDDKNNQYLENNITQVVEGNITYTARLRMTASVTVNYAAEAANGTIKAYVGSKEITTGTKLAPGTVLTFRGTANDTLNYLLKSWENNGEIQDTVESEWTVAADHNMDVKAAFMEKPKILTDSKLPSGMVNRWYEVKFETDYDGEELKFTLGEDSTLPEGLSIQEDGTMKGVLLRQQEAEFEVQLLTKYGAFSYPFSFDIEQSNVPVTDITGLPERMFTTDSLELSGKIEPKEATGRKIIYSIKDQGSTEAVLDNNNVLSAPKAGTIIMTVTVQDGLITENYIKDFKIDVAEPPKKPSITLEPEDVEAIVGNEVRFRIEAQGDDPLSYQWYRKEGTQWQAIDGAKEAEYVINKVNLEMNGYQYYCTVSNAIGDVTTKQVMLTVTPVPKEYYQVTVRYGSDVLKKGPYEAGTKVVIDADTAPDGKVFDHWESSSAKINMNGKGALAVFTMPAENVTITAAFRNIEVPKPAPAWIQARTSGSYSIQLYWAGVDDANQYEIYRSTHRKFGYKLVKTLENANDLVNYENEGLHKNTTYFYKVRAITEEQKGIFSKTVKAAAKAGISKPAKVKDLKAKTSGRNTILLAWRKVSKAKGYIVYRTEDPDKEYKPIAKIGASSTKYKDKKVKSKKIYYYRVCAYRLNGKTKVIGSYSSYSYARCTNGKLK